MRWRCQTLTDDGRSASKGEHISHGDLDRFLGSASRINLALLIDGALTLSRVVAATWKMGRSFELPIAHWLALLSTLAILAPIYGDLFSVRGGFRKFFLTSHLNS